MNSRRFHISAATGVLIAAIAFLAGSAPAAVAHDALAEAVPAADQVITEPLEEVVLTFSEAPLEGFDVGLVISVIDPSGKDVSSGDIAISDTTLSKAVTLVAAGTHTVQWRTVSADGHPISGEYSFTYSAPATPSAEPSDGSASPSPRVTTPTETASPSPQPVDAEESTFPIGIVIVGILLLFLVLAAVVVAFATALRAKRSKASSAEDSSADD
jgi:methionine-rich copper-binding protein CopC